MNYNFKIVSVGSMTTKAMTLTENHNIMQIVVVDKGNRPVGMFYLHELLEAGIERNEW